MYCNGCGNWSIENLNRPTDVCQNSSPSSNSSSSGTPSIVSTESPMICGRATEAVAVAKNCISIRKLFYNTVNLLPTSASDKVTLRATADTTFSEGIIAAKSSGSETVSTVAVMICSFEWWICDVNFETKVNVFVNERFFISFDIRIQEVYIDIQSFIRYF